MVWVNSYYACVMCDDIWGALDALFQLTFKRIQCRDFPGRLVIKTPCFHCRGQGFDLWLVNGDPTCHRAQPKNRKHKNKKQWPTVVAMIFNYLKTFQNILLSREVIWGVFFKKTQKLSAFYFSWNLPGTYYMQPLFTFMISSDSHNNFIDQETNKQKKSE